MKSCSCTLLKLIICCSLTEHIASMMEISIKFLELRFVLYIGFILMKVLVASGSQYEDIIKNTEKPRIPIVIVPGLLGSQLEANFNRPQTAHLFCMKQSFGWQHLWCDLFHFLPISVDCFIDNLMMSYDKEAKMVSNAPGVQMRGLDYGGLDGVQDMLYLLSIGYGKTFNKIIKHFKSLGYEPNKNLRGAPFDWRRAPVHNLEFFPQLENLIEETYKMNENTPNVLLCQSLGCLYSVHFLQRQKQSWKDKHIKRLVTVSAPWAGSVLAVEAILAGVKIPVVGMFYGPKKFRPLIRSMSTPMFLLPRKDAAWNPFLTYVDKDFGIEDYEDFFDLANITNAREIRKDSDNDMRSMDHPGVDISCAFGKNVTTVERVVYNKPEDFPDKPEKVNGKGDGLVNINSLRVCKVWAKQNQYDFDSKGYMNSGHIPLIYNDDFIAHLTELIAKML